MADYLNYMKADERFYRFVLEGKRIPRGGGDPLPFTIKGWTPENIMISTAANFEAKMGGGLLQTAQALNPLQGVGGIGGAVGNVINGGLSVLGNGGLSAFIGVSDVTQEMTLQTWVSSEPLTFTIPLLLNAESSSREEVYYNMVELLKLPLPWKKNFAGVNWLAGPGLNYSDFVMKKDDVENVSLSIGKMVYIPVVIIDSVSSEVDTMYDAEGYPISARVDLQIRTPFVPTREDLDQWFNGFSKLGQKPTLDDFIQGSNVAPIRKFVDGVGSVVRNSGVGFVSGG